MALQQIQLMDCVVALLESHKKEGSRHITAVVLLLFASGISPNSVTVQNADNIICFIASRNVPISRFILNLTSRRKSLSRKSKYVTYHPFSMFLS